MVTQTFVVPVVSFRHLEAPPSAGSHCDYFAIVKASDLPDLSKWRKINVRDPKLRGAVPNKIRDGIENSPDLFMFMNRGLVIAAEKVTFDNKKNVANITLSNPALHGLLDGGHSYNIVQESNPTSETELYVKVEIITGFDRDEVTLVVDARNTSNQVRDESLMNLQGEFNDLKKALKSQSYYNDISWSEFETDKQGDPKALDVRELISILMCFDRTHFTDTVHPVNAYRSKAAALAHFKDHASDFKKLYKIAPELFELHDQIHLALPDLYNEARKASGLSGGKFGLLTGVTVYKEPKPLSFCEGGSTYGVPSGFIFPILGAFRALLVEVNGHYQWAKDCNPKQMLKGELGLKLAETLGNNALEVQNPSKTGKSINLWQTLYTEAKVRHLQIQLKNMKQ